MPPKGSKAPAKEQAKTTQKTKADAKTATPTKTFTKTTKTATKQTPKKEEPKKEEPKPVTPKKPKEAAKYSKLARSDKATLPIEVTVQGDILQAKQVKANYTHAVKFDATTPFTLVDTYVVPEGQQYEGHQVVLLKPSQAFKFMKLSKELRIRIYTYLFYTKGQGSQSIVIDGKRKYEPKDPYAKSFAQGSKYRVAILTANKEINKEATPVLYSRPIRCETPSILMNFFGNLDNHLRVHLRHIEIRTYVKKDARNALTFLAEAKGLEHLRLESDVVKDDDPVHAAGLFWPDICKLLEAVGSRLEKTMVPPRKVIPPEPDVKGEESSQEEESESESESEEEDEGEDNETENSDDSAKSDNAEAQDTNDGAKSNETKDVNGDVAMSDEPKDAEDVKMDTTKPDDNKLADTNLEETHTSDAVEKASEPGKKDPKSPTPAVPVKKNPAEPEPPKLIQGRKCFAVDILHFGKMALKNKDGKLWDNAKKEQFLTALEAKLK
ncbi:hypothetical protein MBLNU13_g06217t1 [Cladosporium sp. NU13]